MSLSSSATSTVAEPCTPPSCSPGSLLCRAGEIVDLLLRIPQRRADGLPSWSTATRSDPPNPLPRPLAAALVRALGPLPPKRRRPVYVAVSTRTLVRSPPPDRPGRLVHSPDRICPARGSAPATRTGVRNGKTVRDSI